MQNPQITIIEDHRNPRQRTRLVALEHMAKIASHRATKSGAPVTDCEHGGTVANAYNYPASTEAVVVVAFPSGQVAVWTATIPANKATLSGAAVACLGDWVRPVWDNRYPVGHPREVEAENELVRRAAHLIGAPHDEAACVEDVLA